ncbi:Insertion element IS1 2/3 protein insB (fragment) [Xenorhabdus bovienii str. kraussei Quebec]|uniref:Insertion element IS1 2/3 protein insB n=1 Tax=Xenorhabdus bovienii str. kraussei Quebec TaxID=1398203 RepID=A0A077PHA4_XENBV
MPGDSTSDGDWPEYRASSFKKLKPKSVTEAIKPGTEVIVCCEMDEQWSYVKSKKQPPLALLCLRQDKTKSDRPCFWSQDKKDINVPTGFADPFQYCYLYDGWLAKL